MAVHTYINIHAAAVSAAAAKTTVVTRNVGGARKLVRCADSSLQ